MFNLTTPASKYLQAKGIDYLTANKQIKSLVGNISSMRDKFKSIHERAMKFATHVKEQLAEKGFHEDEMKFRICFLTKGSHTQRDELMM